MVIIFTLSSFTFTSEHLDILILQKAAGGCATFVEKKAIQYLIVLQESGRNHASFVGALGMVGVIANRFCDILVLKLFVCLFSD